MSDFRDSYSPPLLETIPPKFLSPPPVKPKRKKSDVLPLSPQSRELDTIWEAASRLSLFLAGHDMTSLSPQHLETLERLLDQKEKLQEQLSEKNDQNRFLQQDLSSCTRERDVLIAQLNQLTATLSAPTLSEYQLDELDGLRTCPESDLLSMEPRARRFWDEFLRQRGELETQRDIVSERDNEVRDLLSERANARVLLEHLERLVSLHERSLRSTVVKRNTARNRVSSEVEVLRALKCLFGHHKTLDRVKDKLKHQVARTKELEDQLTEALAQRQLNQLEKYKPSDSLGQLIEREREIEPLRFEMEELRPIRESQLEQSTQQLDDSRELYGLAREWREESNKYQRETETIELREELEEKGRSERLMELRLQQTVEKLSLVQKDKMDLEQILHERMEPANQRRGSRRTKKASRQSIAEIYRTSDTLGDTSHSLSHRRLQEPVRQTDRHRRAHNYSPDVTPFSSRKSSPIEEAKQSPTESEGVGPAHRGNHSSLSDIDITIVLDNSPFKRKSSIRRIVSSFRTNRASVPKEVPPPLSIPQKGFVHKKTLKNSLYELICQPRSS